MSIIHDALKKAQANLGHQNPSALPTVETVRQSVEKTPNTRTKPASTPLWAYGLLVILIPTAFFMWKKLDSQKPLLGESIKPVVKTIPVVAPIKPVVVPVAKPAPAVVIPPPAPVIVQAPTKIYFRGVINSGGSKSALINDDVYQEGDDVEGMTIIKIDTKTIIVDNNGKRINLRVGQKI